MALGSIERLIIIALVLVGFAERIKEIDARIHQQTFVSNLTLHRGDFLVAETKRLQIRKCPISLTKTRVCLDAVSVGFDSFLLTADDLLRIT